MAQLRLVPSVIQCVIIMEQTLMTISSEKQDANVAETNHNLSISNEKLGSFDNRLK